MFSHQIRASLPAPSALISLLQRFILASEQHAPSRAPLLQTSIKQGPESTGTAALGAVGIKIKLSQLPPAFFQGDRGGGVGRKQASRLVLQLSTTATWA